MSGTPSPHMIKLTGKKWLTAAIVVVVAVLALKMLMPEKKRPVAEENNPQNECANNAAVEYNNAKLGLLLPQNSYENLTGDDRLEKLKKALIERARQPDQLISVDTTLAERRLEEQFCLQLARCVISEPTAALYALRLASVFNNCLQREALEKYDAVLRAP
jgi:hypothetical protein